MKVDAPVKTSCIEGEEYERGDNLHPVVENYPEGKLQKKGPDNREYPEVFVLVDLFVVCGLDWWTDSAAYDDVYDTAYYA